DRTIPDLASYDEEKLQDVLLLLKEYAAYVPFVGEDYKSNPWNGLTKSDSSLQNKREVQNAIDSLFQLVRELPQPLEEASRLYGIAAVNLLDAYNVSLLLELLSKAREINVPLLDASKRNLVARSIRALDAQSLTVKTIQEPLDALFDERVFSLNGKENRERLVRLYDGFFYRLLSSGSGASSHNSKELRDAVDALLLLVDEIQESLNEIARLYDIRCATLIDVYNIYHLFPILSKTKALGPKFLNASILERVARELTEMDEQKAKLQESREAIDALFDKEIYELDGKDSRLRLVRLYSGFFTRLFNSEYKSLSKKLRLYKRDGQKLSYQDEIDAMEKLECFQENAAAFDARVESLGEFVAPSVLENDDARKALKEALNQLVKFNGPQTPLGRLPSMSDQEFEEERATLARVASSFEASFKKYVAQISYASKSFKLSSFKIQNASPWYREFANTLDLYQRDGKKLSYMEQIDAMEKLEEYQKNVKQFNDQAESLDAFVSPSLLKNDDSRSSLKTSLEKLSLLCDQNVPLGRLPKMNLAEFEEERGKFERLAGALGKAFQASDSVIFRAEDYFDRAKLDIQRDPREKVERRVDACRKSLGADVNAIDEWIHFETHILPPLAAHNLLPFVDAAISANIPCQDVADAFQRLCREEQIESIIASTPELSRFNQISQDQTVQIFSEKDSAQFSVNKARLRAFLSSLRPSSEYVVPGSEVHTLLREGEKKRKQKSIRVLLSEISDLALLLKPCFLMSPLSVSTFLAGDSLHFDTVVFDEASQIFPQDALGSIYRADQLIVVGDSKQMPPSNFFNASNDSDLDEDEDDDSGVYESVLDLCATSLPVQSLSWHYRSRHESLIAFSNKNFYESKLVSFPSTLRQQEGIGVDYYYVENGTFDRKLRHNYKEASLVVDLIYRHFKETPKRSLGIVAFSQSQQKLIERLLKQRRLKEQDKEEFFRSDVPEPFFVKNLETVQGDERDTIIFSVAYAKGTDGKFLHNFGPLNRQKGERRLNVAVTRAKLNVKVVASIRGSDINLDQAKSDGAKLLREYLEYAEKGIDALNVETPQETLYDSTDDFVDEVYDALVEKGYRVDKRVGASGLKIDLAIKIPDADDYFFAVECDGEAYRRSKNARDRDRLRQEVLERSGWRYYRLWSTEWFKNRGRSLERLLHAMEEALTTRSSAPSSAPIAVPTNASDDVPSFEEKVDGSDDDHFPRYRAADVDAIIARFPGELQKIVHAILEVEAPLSEELLIKRIVGYFGREKVTSVVLQEYESQMTGHQRLNIYKQNGFLYLETSGPLSLRAPGDLKRDVVQIAPQEIAAGMMQLIQENVSLDKTSLYQGILRICEARMSQGVRERLDSALQLLGNRVVVEGERVSIPQ
ncbi:MAG: AAA domain-containing protein, partial [Thermoguttaceae bacterium]